MDKCKDCKWWFEWTHKTEEYLLNNPNNKDKGDCRKNAPVVVGRSEEGYACWPDTNLYNYCGNFETKNETTP